jgi:hypothetical protein
LGPSHLLLHFKFRVSKCSVVSVMQIRFLGFVAGHQSRFEFIPTCKS